jgi:hypothetical protein
MPGQVGDLPHDTGKLLMWRRPPAGGLIEAAGGCAGWCGVCPNESFGVSLAGLTENHLTPANRDPLYARLSSFALRLSGGWFGSPVIFCRTATDLEC